MRGDSAATLARPGVLAHEVSGAGAPLVFLNGGLMSLGAWAEIVNRFEATFRVIRCDFRGQLRSPGPPPAMLDGHAADLVELLDLLGVHRAHVAGTSFGAEVALLLAAQHPERVASVTAVAATDHVPLEASSGARPVREACRAVAAGGDAGVVFDLIAPATFSASFRSAHPELMAERRRQLAALPRRWFADLDRLLGSVAGLDLRPQLGRIRCPVLVVAAELDATFPLACSQALAAAIPGAKLAVVAGSGHGLVIEKPQCLVELLRSFLHDVTQQGRDGKLSPEGGMACSPST